MRILRKRLPQNLGLPFPPCILFISPFLTDFLARGLECFFFLGYVLYNGRQIAIEKFLEDPGDKDIKVNQVFTDSMFDELEKDMDSAGWDKEHRVRKFWTEDFRNRKIVSGFLKDPVLGSKRLASMPDRVTNTINVADSDEPVCRPTVINMYDGDLSSQEQWWKFWNHFMFHEKLSIKGSDGTINTVSVYELLVPIKKSKYPDITEEEEAISLPLSTMCAAIFDGILVQLSSSFLCWFPHPLCLAVLTLRLLVLLGLFLFQLSAYCYQKIYFLLFDFFATVLLSRACC